MSRAYGILSSTRTSLALLGLQLLLFLAGAIQMPRLEAYGAMNSMPLIKWMLSEGLGVTWWLWASIVCVALLVVNTLFCSAESIMRRGGRDLMSVFAPQVVHVGFLFMMLAHLLSGYGGFKGSVTLPEGAYAKLPDGNLLMVNKVDIRIGDMGYPLDWRADIAYYSGAGQRLRDDYLAPNRPSFYEQGMVVYLKNVRPGVAFVEVVQDPGALWSMIGGVLFTLGTVALVMNKIRRER